MTWNGSALALSAGSSLAELPNSASTNDWISMSGNTLLLHLNDTAGSTTFADSSGASNNATCTTCPTAGGASKFATGATFNGTTQFLQLPSGVLAASTTQTYSAWFKTTASGAIFGESFGSYPTALGGSYTPVLYVGTDGKLRGQIYNGSVSPLTSALAVNDGKWHHAALTTGTNTQSLYLDGLLVGSMAGAPTHTAGGNTMNVNYVGTAYAGGSWPLTNSSWFFFNGSLDEVALWNRTLSTAEIQALYETQAASYSGTALSRVMDAGGAVSWSSLAWTPDRPYGKELPGSAQSETAYSAGNASMSGNTLLLHLNETSGTTFTDSSGGGNTVSCTTCPSLGQPGRYSNAPLFDGTSQSISLGTGAALNFGANAAFSIEGWVRTGEAAGPILSFRSSASQNAVIDISIGYNGPTTTNGALMALLRDDSGGVGYAQVVGPVVNDMKWHHFAFTRDTAGTIELFVDGVTAGNTFGTATAGAVTTDWRYLGVEKYWSVYGGGTADQNYLAGSIDEIAVYSRKLTNTEITDRFRRGATRIRYQIRSCSTAACTGTAFIGPDSTSSTTFSEISNSTLGLPSLAMAPASAQYFQYKAFFDSESSSYLPQLSQVAIGPQHYDAGSPAISNSAGLTFSQLSTLAQTLGAGNQGTVTYQISRDGGTWYYWNGSAWAIATTVANSNAASVISTNLPSFATQVGTGTFYFKALLNSSAGTQAVELDQLDLAYTN